MSGKNKRKNLDVRCQRKIKIIITFLYIQYAPETRNNCLNF